MSRAKVDSAVYRPDLGQAVMEFFEDPAAGMGFIGLEIMPIFRTAVQSGSYPVIPKEALLKLASVDRTPRGLYGRDDYEYERGQFQTAERGFEELLDDSERALFDQEAPGMAEFVATQRAWWKIMRGQERRIAAKIFNASNFSANAVSVCWDVAATATPIDDVKTGIGAFRKQCGMLPDALVISYTTYLALQVADQIVDQLKYTFPGIDVSNLNVQQMARVLGVPRLLVGDAVYDSAGKGQSSTISDIWDDEYAALIKIGNGPDLTQPSVGRTFLWTEDSPQNPIVEEYREENRRSDVYRVRHHVAEEFIASKNDSGTVVSNVAAACVYLFSNIDT